MTTADLVDDPGLRRSLSAVEVTQAFLERIEALQPRIRALITVTPELALADARRADRARAAGDPLPLDGMPIVIKDNVDVAGIRTSVGSRLFAERVADADAEIVRRLHVAGAVVLGKANMHELAFGATSRNEAFGHIVNPQAPDRIPGGSSGGSGAAVAADMCVAAIGTDTGGLHQTAGVGMRRLGPPPDLRSGPKSRHPARQRLVRHSGAARALRHRSSPGARRDLRLRPPRSDLTARHDAPRWTRGGCRSPPRHPSGAVRPL